ncbi:hypothetical protein FRB99_003518 [Tulasnella sp. 403]|nr:hypothetical protein FRB99_003518 [Tulasnella sp. 403]
MRFTPAFVAIALGATLPQLIASLPLLSASRADLVDLQPVGVPSTTPHYFNKRDIDLNAWDAAYQRWWGEGVQASWLSTGTTGVNKGEIRNFAFRNGQNAAFDEVMDGIERSRGLQSTSDDKMGTRWDSLKTKLENQSVKLTKAEEEQLNSILGKLQKQEMWTPEGIKDGTGKIIKTLDGRPLEDALKPASPAAPLKKNNFLDRLRLTTSRKEGSTSDLRSSPSTSTNSGASSLTDSTNPRTGSSLPNSVDTALGQAADAASPPANTLTNSVVDIVDAPGTEVLDEAMTRMTPAADEVVRQSKWTTFKNVFKSIH